MKIFRPIIEIFTKFNLKGNINSFPLFQLETQILNDIQNQNA